MKIHKIMSLDQKQTFDKIKNPFLIKKKKPSANQPTKQNLQSDNGHLKNK